MGWKGLWINTSVGKFFRIFFFFFFFFFLENGKLWITFCDFYSVDLGDLLKINTGVGPRPRHSIPVTVRTAPANHSDVKPAAPHNQ